MSHVWSASELPERYSEDSWAAGKALLAVPGWPEWLLSYVGPADGTGEGIHILYIEDREKRRIVVRGEDLSFYEPATALADAAKRGVMVEYFVGVYLDLYTRWAEKKGLPLPPPVAPTPPEGRG